jgi:ABC-type transport system involved in cytochrome c biogenesis permease subunit
MLQPTVPLGVRWVTNDDIYRSLPLIEVFALIYLTVSLVTGRKMVIERSSSSAWVQHPFIRLDISHSDDMIG